MENFLFVNGIQEQKIERLNRVVDSICNELEISNEKMKFFIDSTNNFPTAAGLASSASGFASVAYGICKIMGINDKKIQSCVARVGSGSACRSIHGGFVKWVVENDDCNFDSSFGVQLFNENHWEDLKLLILVLTENKKSVSSTKGMKYSEKTKHLEKRVNEFVPLMIPKMEKSIEEKDAETFFQLTIDDCENFHNVCMNTTPQLNYRSESSLFVCDVIRAFNQVKGKTFAGYTFDAGPNAILLCESENLEELKYVVSHFFPEDEKEIHNSSMEKVVREMEKIIGEKKIQNGIIKTIETKIGPGPYTN